ncbi:MAG: glycosyltransferase family 39 protein [Candidatus Kapabacteria bacterium]|nr:glycosyltransferase family 39 protein [Candidatus Kapabacteria bacterium]
MNKVLRWLIILGSILFVLTFVIMAVIRMNYPFELEWMEGGSVDHTQRILNGQGIYVEPSVEFIPYIYTPFYYYVSGLFSLIFGVGLFPLRLVSTISTIATGAFIFLLLKKETKDTFAAIISTGLFFGFYVIGGAWYDLARVDSLFILLFVISIYFLRQKKNNWYYFLAALFAFLSYFTKQSTLSFALFVMIYLIIFERKGFWTYSITFIGLVLITTIIYNYSTSGWYYFWNFELPAAHRWNFEFTILFFTRDIFEHTGIAVAFAFFYFFINYRNRKDKSIDIDKTYIFYLFVFLGMFAGSYFSRLHYGGFLNVIIPAYTILAIMTGLCYNQIMNLINSNSHNEKQINYTFQIILNLMVIAQFLAVVYDPGLQLPSEKDFQAGNEFIEKVKEQEGDVLIPGNTYTYYILAGKKNYAHIELINDLYEHNETYGKKVMNDFKNKLENHYFTVIYANKLFIEHFPFFKDFYEEKEPIFNDESSFKTKTGHIMRPEWIYVPKSRANSN